MEKGGIIIPSSVNSSPSSSPSRHSKPSQFTLKLDLQDCNDNGLELRKRSLSDNPVTLSTAATSPVEIIEMPVTDPESPAYFALAKANEKVDPDILEKRVRIGKAKLGRTKYKTTKQRFKKPHGNEINDQHEQYALTYGMMCGILNSAGLQNPFKQRLTMDDFMRVDKKEFPANSKLQHPFKFKDYSPDIFRQIRRRFCIDNADYMVTLCGDFNYIEFMSNSKSGQFFFYSHDGRFMIKTQTKNESKFLRRILPHYYKFVMENPNTLITRFYGMHRVKMHHLRRKMHFIIMASVFDTPLEIHRRFDLKGSRVGRRASSKEKANNGVLKDMDLLESDFRLQMGAELRAMLLVQIRKDVEFLKRMKIMDYSLLIGVHNSRQVVHTNDGIATNLNGSPRNDSPHAGSLTSPAKSPIISGECVSSYSRQQGDSSPCERSMSKETTNIPDIVLPPTQLCRSCSLPERSNTVMESEALNRFSEGTAELDFDFDSESESEHSSNEEFVEFSPSIEPLSPRVLDVEKYPGHSESIFCHDEGGIYGRDRYGRKNGYVYFLGVIDILQQYNSRKIAETFFKGFRHNRKQISAVNPNFYGDRFIEFVEKNVVLDDTLPIHD